MGGLSLLVLLMTGVMWLALPATRSGADAAGAEILGDQGADGHAAVGRHSMDAASPGPLFRGCLRLIRLAKLGFSFTTRRIRPPRDGRPTSTTTSCGILVRHNRVARELPQRHDRGRADDSHAAAAGVSPSRAGSLPWRAAASLRATAGAGAVAASPPNPAISTGPRAIHQGLAARPASATPTRLTRRHSGRADAGDERLAHQTVRAGGSRDCRAHRATLRMRRPTTSRFIESNTRPAKPTAGPAGRIFAPS